MNRITANRLESVKEYYFSRKLKEVATLIKEGKPILNMGIGSPDLPPHPKVIDALQSSLTHPKAHAYQSYQGIPELREAIALFYKTHYKVNFKPTNEILPLIGSKEGIMHISMAFLNKGDKVLIPNPGYPTYTSVTRLVEAIPVEYKLTATSNWQPDIEELEKMDLTDVKLMWLNYPNMPTGAKLDTSVIQSLIDFARKHKILLVHDNPYSFILSDSPQSIFSFENAKDVCLELNSLSKAFNLAGWRVGMLVGNSENIASVLKVKSNMDSGMFYGIQKGAIAALNLSKSWFEELNKIYLTRRKAMEKLALSLGSIPNKEGAGMFVWAKLNDSSIESEQFIEEVLHKYNIFITPGTIFGSQGEGYIRFSLCIEKEKIEEAINRVKG